jgi:hypothetical protein
MAEDAQQGEEAQQRQESMIAALKRLQGKSARERVEPNREGAAAPPEWQPPRPGK